MSSDRGEEVLLRTAGLNVDFLTPAGDLRAVEDVNLVVHRGETLGVVGESGSGKSVLLRAIMGLTPTAVARPSGSVVFDGTELIGQSRRRLRKLWGSEIAIVFQDPMTSLNPVVRVGRQIAEGIGSAERGSRAQVRARSIELLRLVGISEPERRLRQYPHEMSGGMRQRVAIAMALAGSPRLLLADEPTTALDVTVQAQILDLLRDLQTKLNMAMILVTHDLGVVANRADRIAVMYAGQIVETAPTRPLFRSTRMPYTDALMRSIPALDEPSHTRLYNIGGRPPSLASRPRGCRFAPRCSRREARCDTQAPDLVTSLDKEHLYRCWYPLESSELSPAAIKLGTVSTARPS